MPPVNLNTFVTSHYNNQMKKEEKKIRDARIPEMIAAIKKAFKSDKGFSDEVVSKMQELRAVFIELEQPTLVKSIRLVYEYAQTFDGFSIDLWEEESKDGSLNYFLDLIENAHNKYNREEIKALNVFLKARLAGEEAEFVRPDDEEEDV